MRAFLCRLLVFLTLLVLGAICPATAQDNGEDFGMTGVMLVGQENFRAVSRVLPHSPADDAGIKAGDTVLAISDVSTSGLTMNEFIAKMRGKPGSEVVVTILSQESGVIFNFTLKRVSARAYYEANP